MSDPTTSAEFGGHVTGDLRRGEPYASQYPGGAAELEREAPTQPSAALTPSNLLADMRRLEASLSLLRPPPPFAAFYT